MPVLILSPFFFPEAISTGRYNTALARTLAERGKEVTVFSSHPLYPSWRPKRSQAVLPEIKIQRGGGWLRYPRTPFLRRAVLEIWYAAFALAAYLRIGRHKPRCVIPIFPPCLFLALLHPLLPSGTSVVGIVHDLQGVLGVRSDSVIGKLARAGIRWIERRSFAKCDRLIFLSHSMLARAIQDYALRREICSVHYPFQTLPSQPTKSTSTLRETLPADYVNVVYSGALGDKQSPDELLRFMADLERRNANVRCHVFSAGPHFERLRRDSQTRCGVKFHALVAEDDLAELYARSSVQIIPQAGGTSDGALPSKLPNLIAAGVPIFAICDEGSEVAEILKAAGTGLTAPNFLSSVTLERFDTLLAVATSESTASRAKRLKPFVEKHFSIEPLVDEILNSPRRS